MSYKNKERIMAHFSPSEHDEQVAFIEAFRLQYPHLLIYAIPNGGLRNIVVAKKLKAAGVVVGVPDLFIPQKHCFIEMKRVKGGRLSEAQLSIIGHLRDCNYQVIVAKGAEDALKQFKDFLKQKC